MKQRIVTKGGITDTGDPPPAVFVVIDAIGTLPGAGA
jgi:hypothetical protein